MNKLIVVGSGIKSIAHLTEETKRIIQSADKVLYLVNEDNLKLWIQREAKIAESLESIYFGSNNRVEVYANITNHILSEYENVAILCVVFYGHPTVFADSALSAVRHIKANNGSAIILPAISSLDCLFSDLQIDPGHQGCFTIDATELLIYERFIDPFAHIILLQIFNLGMHDTARTNKLNILYNYLLLYYPNEYPVCIYEAAILPTQLPRMQWIKLQDLSIIDLKPISTLYIPPNKVKGLSEKNLTLLKMNIKNFKLSTKPYTSSK